MGGRRELWQPKWGKGADLQPPRAASTREYGCLAAGFSARVVSGIYSVSQCFFWQFPTSRARPPDAAGTSIMSIRGWAICCS